ncbi:MAG: hypothetical protein MHMPM18_002325 [Marteilia pararefringens]
MNWINYKVCAVKKHKNWRNVTAGKRSNVTQQPRQSYRTTEDAKNKNEGQSRRSCDENSNADSNFPLSNDLKFLQTMRRIDQQIASRRSTIPNAADSITDGKFGHDSSGRFEGKGGGMNESPKFDLIPDLFDGCETINEEEIHHNDSLDH